MPGKSYLFHPLTSAARECLCRKNSPAIWHPVKVGIDGYRVGRFLFNQRALAAKEFGSLHDERAKQPSYARPNYHRDWSLHWH